MQCVLKAGASEFWYPWIISMGIAWSCISLYHFIILYPDLVVTLGRIIIIYVWVSAFLLPPWTLAFLPPQSAVKCMPGWKPWHMGQTYSEEQITRLQCKRNIFSRLWPAAGLRCATLIGQKNSCCYQQQSIEECHVKLFHHAICHKIVASELQWHQGVLPPMLAH